MPGTASSTSPRDDRVTLFPMVLKQVLTKLLTLAIGLAPGYLAAQGPRFNIQDLGTRDTPVASRRDARSRHLRSPGILHVRPSPKSSRGLLFEAR